MKNNQTFKYISFFNALIIIISLACNDNKPVHKKSHGYSSTDTIQILQSSLSVITMLEDLYPYKDSSLKLIASSFLPDSCTLYWMNHKVLYLDSNQKNMLVDTFGMAAALRHKSHRVAAFELVLKDFIIRNDTARLISIFKNTGQFIKYSFLKKEGKWLLFNYTWGWR